MPSTKRSVLTVGGLTVEVVRKDIKNIHLGVYPPHGRIRIAVPEHINDEAARLAVINKLSWLKKQISEFERQPRLSEHEAISGESWYFFGRRYRLKVVEVSTKPEVSLPNKSRIELHIPAHTTAESRLLILDRWYRKQLKEAAQPLVSEWETRMGVKADFWGVKRMKTKWGSCNHETKRIWLNSELAKKPIDCLEYIVVHELVHLIEPSHNENFVQLMTKFLPNWESLRDMLNSTPLAHEEWQY
jgi:predicted metal-dependent hydrolase